MPEVANILNENQPNNPRFRGGTKTRKAEFALTDTSTIGAGDFIVLATGLGFTSRVSEISSNIADVPSLTGATDVDVGLYYKNSAGELVPYDNDGTSLVDLLWDGVSLATGGGAGVNLLFALNAALSQSDNLGELAGGLGADKDPNGGLYLVMTFNTSVTASEVLGLKVEIDEATTS